MPKCIYISTENRSTGKISPVKINQVTPFARRDFTKKNDSFFPSDLEYNKNNDSFEEPVGSFFFSLYFLRTKN